MQKYLIYFVSTHNEQSMAITGITRKHWPIIGDSFQYIPEFQKFPLMLYRCSNNVRDKLDISMIPSNKETEQRFLAGPKVGSNPCLGCINCRLMQKGDRFIHPGIKEEHKIRHHLMYNSEWVICVLLCPCHLLYLMLK